MDAFHAPEASTESNYAVHCAARTPVVLAPAFGETVSISLPTHVVTTPDSVYRSIDWSGNATMRVMGKGHLAEVSASNLPSDVVYAVVMALRNGEISIDQPVY